MHVLIYPNVTMIERTDHLAAVLVPVGAAQVVENASHPRPPPPAFPIDTQHHEDLSVFRG